ASTAWTSDSAPVNRSSSRSRVRVRLWPADRSGDRSLRGSSPWSAKVPERLWSLPRLKWPATRFMRAAAGHRASASACRRGLSSPYPSTPAVPRSVFELDRRIELLPRVLDHLGALAWPRGPGSRLVVDAHVLERLLDLPARPAL